MVGELAPLDLALDQRLHLAQALEDAVVEIASIHEGPHRRGVDLGVARRRGDRARLDLRVALPVATVAQQVVLERGEARDQGPASRRRAAGAGRRETRSPRRVGVPSSAPAPAPRRVKNSSLAMARAPSVSPCSGNSSTRSMSEEKLSSPPPSLPMPTTISGCASPRRGARLPVARDQARAGVRERGRDGGIRKRAADPRASRRGRPRPARSRQAMRTNSRRRQLRSHACTSASLAAASAGSAAARRANSPGGRARSRSPLLRRAASRCGSRLRDRARKSLEAMRRGSTSRTPAGAAESAARVSSCAPSASRARVIRPSSSWLIPGGRLSSRCCPRGHGRRRCRAGGSCP